MGGVQLAMPWMDVGKRETRAQLGACGWVRDGTTRPVGGRVVALRCEHATLSTSKLSGAFNLASTRHARVTDVRASSHATAQRQWA